MSLVVPRRTPVATRPALLGEIGVVVVLVAVYDRIRDIAATRTDLAFADAARVLRVESWLHLDVEHPVNHWLASHWHVEWAASVYYQLMHLTVTLGVLSWLYLARPDRYRSARNALVYVSGLGLVVFWLMPVAPPRLLAGFVDSGAVTGIAEHTAHVSPDLYAAMPSLHVAWATWVVLQVGPAVRSELVRWVVVTHAAITVAVVVTTANHFVLDVIAGAATAMLATWLAAVPAISRTPREEPVRAAAAAGVRSPL